MEQQQPIKEDDVGPKSRGYIPGYRTHGGADKKLDQLGSDWSPHDILERSN